jgi:hypothetical protein
VLTVYLRAGRSADALCSGLPITGFFGFEQLCTSTRSAPFTHPINRLARAA